MLDKQNNKTYTTFISSKPFLKLNFYKFNKILSNEVISHTFGDQRAVNRVIKI